MIGGRLARATFEPDLMMTDGEAALIANDEAIARPGRPGRRDLEPVPPHVRRGVERPAPRDDGRHPGRPVRQPEHRRPSAATRPSPSVQLLGFRGAPGNTINDTTSYWVPNHAPKVFVRARRHRDRHRLRPGRARSARSAARFHEIRRVVVEPRRVRLRDARPPDAPALGAPRRHGRRGASRPPGSSSSIPDDVAESPAAHPRGARGCSSEVIDPAGHALQRGPRPA